MLDWLAVVALLLGAVAVATGRLPVPAATATIRRLVPLLLFLGSVIVLAELTAIAGVFDVLAAAMARKARGNYFALFLLCVLFASATTIFLNLDTTAVLLTPVMLATAAKAGMPGRPLAMLTVWLANTASLLLPVSNLTNLLAADRVGLSATGLAARMAWPQVVAIAVTGGWLWLLYWRRGARHSDRYTPPPRHQPHDPALFWVAAVICAAFIGLVLAAVPLWLASVICNGLLVAVFALRMPRVLSWRLLPLRLLAFVIGLFLVVETVGRFGLADLVRELVGTDGGPLGVGRAALAGAGLANLVNNLPAYVVVEAVVPVQNGTALLGLLIGTNVGPLITPWASLAIILWHERCRSAGTEIGWRGFVAAGALTATTGVLLATAALIAAS